MHLNSPQSHSLNKFITPNHHEFRSPLNRATSTIFAISPHVCNLPNHEKVGYWRQRDTYRLGRERSRQRLETLHRRHRYAFLQKTVEQVAAGVTVSNFGLTKNGKDRTDKFVVLYACIRATIQTPSSVRQCLIAFS